MPMQTVNLNKGKLRDFKFVISDRTKIALSETACVYFPFNHPPYQQK